MANLETDTKKLKKKYSKMIENARISEKDREREEEEEER